LTSEIDLCFEGHICCNVHRNVHLRSLPRPLLRGVYHFFFFFFVASSQAKTRCVVATRGGRCGVDVGVGGSPRCCASLDALQPRNAQFVPQPRTAMASGTARCGRWRLCAGRVRRGTSIVPREGWGRLRLLLVIVPCLRSCVQARRSERANANAQCSRAIVHERCSGYKCAARGGRDSHERQLREATEGTY